MTAAGAGDAGTPDLDAEQDKAVEALLAHKAEVVAFLRGVLGCPGGDRG